MSTPDPKPEKHQPVISHLEGFPDPVRDPDTGMIVPQTRRERRALEAAQASMLAKKVARHQAALNEAGAVEEAGDDFGSDDLGFGSDPSTDIDPEESTVLTVKQVEPQEITPPHHCPHELPVPESKAGRNLPAAIASAWCSWELQPLGSSVPRGDSIVHRGARTIGMELAQVAKTRNIHLFDPRLGGGLGPGSCLVWGVDAMVFAPLAHTQQYFGPLGRA